MLQAFLKLFGMRVEMVPADGPFWGKLGVEQRQWWRLAAWARLLETGNLVGRRVRLSRDLRVPTGTLMHPPHGTRWLRTGLTGRIVGRVVSFGHDQPREFLLFRGTTGRIVSDLYGVVTPDETAVAFGVWGRFFPQIRGISNDLLQIEEE